MAKTSMKIKQQRKQKFSTREYSRCKICGRPHSVLRKYGICRVCFRELAYNPGCEESKLVGCFSLNEGKRIARRLNLVKTPFRTLNEAKRIARRLSLVRGTCK